MFVLTLSKDGSPLERLTPTSTSRPSRAIVRRSTTVPDSVLTLRTNCWCCDSFCETYQRYCSSARFVPYMLDGLTKVGAWRAACWSRGGGGKLESGEDCSAGCCCGGRCGVGAGCTRCWVGGGALGAGGGGAGVASACCCSALGGSGCAASAAGVSGLGGAGCSAPGVALGSGLGWGA